LALSCHSLRGVTESVDDHIGDLVDDQHLGLSAA